MDSQSLPATINAPPDPGRVLRTLLAHCSGSDTGVGAADLATNAVLEWFGRTIRGRCRIEQFLRYDVRPQYEQRFGGAEASEAFEEKPAHLQTRQVPTTETIVAPQHNASDSDSDLELSCTPTASHQLRPPCLPVPGAPARGRTFISTPSSASSSSSTKSGIEDEDDSRPEDTDLSGVAEHEITPPRQVAESAVVGAATTTGVPGPTMRRPVRRKEAPIMAAYEEAFASGPVQYSGLHYLEACGLVRQSHSAKHQRSASGASAATSVDASDDAALNSSRPGSPQLAGRWERAVRLRVSYRLCNSSWSGSMDNHRTGGIQFALIVYEPLERNPRTRRNLLAAFRCTEAAAAENDVGEAARADAVGQQQPVAERTPLKAEAATAAAAATREVRPPATDAPIASERATEALRRYAASVAKNREAGAVKRTTTSQSFKTSLKRLRF